MSVKILHVITSCEPKQGGPIEGIKQLNKYYSKFKIKAHLLCSDKKNEKWIKDKRLPKVFAIGPKYFNYAYNPKMILWLEKNIKKYDLIIVNGIWEHHNYAVWKVAKKYHKPYFVFTHGMLDPWFKKKYFLKHIKKILYWKLIQYKILKDAKSILYTSHEEKKLAKQSFSPFKLKEKVIGYGIEGNKYNVIKKNNLFLKRFPKIYNKKIILYFGRIHEKKGVDILIKSFSKISNQNRKAHLVIAGPYDKRIIAKLKRLIKIYNLNNSVTFTGPLFDKLKWHTFLAAHVFCLPSHQENFGIAVAEALSSKKPVIITNKVNIFKTIKNNSAGIVTNDNLISFSSGLKKFLQLNKYKYKKYSVNSFKCFLENYQIEQVAKNLAEYIKKNLNKYDNNKK